MSSPSPDSPRARRPGRPLNPQADRAIIDATVDLLTEKGFGGLTMDEVAARAHVGKTTIYRRWPSKEALLATVIHALAEELPVPDTGSLREDLITYLRALFGLWLRSPVALAGVVGEAARNPALREPFHETLAARRARTRTIFDRAVERGEISADFDAEAAIDMLAGSGAYRLLVTGAPLDVDFADRVVTALLGPAPDRRGRGATKAGSAAR